MRFVVYIAREASDWPPPKHPPGEPVVVEMDPEARLADAVAEALEVAGPEVEELYRITEGGPYYWLSGLTGLSIADAPNPELVGFPRVVIADDGEFLWTEGARGQVKLSDLRRARDAGYFAGDPGGIFLQPPMAFDGVIPGWEELLDWLEEFIFIGGVAAFLALIRKHYERWRVRGATTPFAYLDVVVARDAWDRRQLAQLLGLSEKEATELLMSLGFMASEGTPEQWTVSDDPGASALRRKIINDFLHHGSNATDADGEE